MTKKTSESYLKCLSIIRHTRIVTYGFGCHKRDFYKEMNEGHQNTSPDNKRFWGSVTVSGLPLRTSVSVHYSLSLAVQEVFHLFD